MAIHFEHLIAGEHFRWVGSFVDLSCARFGGFVAENCRPRLQKSNVLRCFDPLASLTGTIFFRNYSPWLHMLGFFGRIEYLSFTTKGMMVFQLISLLPDVSFAYLKNITVHIYVSENTYTVCVYIYTYLSLHIHTYTYTQLFWHTPPQKKAPFDVFAWKTHVKNLFGVWAHHGVTWGSGKVPLFPAWPCVRRCLCSGCWTMWTPVDTDTPGRNQGKENALFLGWFIEGF